MVSGSEQVHKGISLATLKHIYWAFYFYLFLFIFYFSVGLFKKGHKMKGASIPEPLSREELPFHQKYPAEMLHKEKITLS